MLQTLQCPWILRADPHCQNESACKLRISAFTLERNAEILVRIVPLAINDDRLSACVGLFGNTRQTGQAVETRVETQYPLDAVSFHYRDMNGISGGEFSFAEYEVTGAFGV